ncbi:TetR/AcrR family transcriptional regulator [Mycolicibacterium sp. S2-37]|uniref:TetR/AcrR family transcriptional regulator n=1 Tax=Mycolicibacterium sp. S2-37 TaxID=2810297 RepID=UPI001A946DEA|nr:TetR/AcrR family transcriptional regulator [Mycolicibacterium sp. S2-37]MBO0678724.1 TetR/AcrR family transcriptional regulator [Mycolicibacterium sp. S2-37]
MTRRRTASEQVSAALLHAAEAVLDRDGTAGVTIRAVAAEAGVAPMSVYNRFDNKDGLLAALAMRALDDLAAAIDTSPDAGAVDRFRRACRSYRGYAVQHPARYLLIFTVGSPLEDQSTAAADHGRAVFAVLVELIRAIAPGETGADPTEAAQAVWSAVHGAVTIEIARIGQTPDPAASYERTVDLLIDGLTAHSGL